AMNAPICCTMAQKTARPAINLAEAPEFAQGEAADRPMAAPNVRSTKERAAASTAPANTALHSTKLLPPSTLVVAGEGPTCVIGYHPLCRFTAGRERSE